MPRLILMDELHVRVSVPGALPAAARAAVRRHLAGRAFRRRVALAIRALLAGPATGSAIRVRLIR